MFLFGKKQPRSANLSGSERGDQGGEANTKAPRTMGASHIEMTQQGIAMVQRLSDIARANPLDDAFGKVDTKAVKEALDLLLRSLDITDEQPRAWAALSQLGLLLGHTDDAKKYLQKAQALDPTDDFVVFVRRLFGT